MPSLANTHRGRKPGPPCGLRVPASLGAEMRRDRDEPVAELQWLEDGIKIIVTHTVLYTKVIALGLIQLYRQWRR